MVYIFISPLVDQIIIALGIAAIAGGMALAARRGSARFLNRLSPTRSGVILRAIYVAILFGGMSLAVKLSGVDGAWLLATILIAFWIGALWAAGKSWGVTLPVTVLPNLPSFTIPFSAPSLSTPPLSAPQPSPAPTPMQPLTVSAAPHVDELAKDRLPNVELPTEQLISDRLPSDPLPSDTPATSVWAIRTSAVTPISDLVQIQLRKPAQLSRRPPLGKRTSKVLQPKR